MGKPRKTPLEMFTPKPRMVRKVKPHLMEGATALERELNAYLTARFVLSANVPADECLKEARDIIAIIDSQTAKGK